MESRTNGSLRRALWIARPVLALAVAAAPRALAWGRHHARPSTPAELSKRLDHGLEHLLDELDATEVQRARAAQLADARAPALFAIMNEGHALRQKAKGVLLADKLDETQLAALRTQLDSVYARGADIALDGLFELAEVLTPKQRRELAERLARFEH